MQLCGSLSIHCLCISLGLEWKLDFPNPVATAEFSKFTGILSGMAYWMAYFSGLKRRESQAMRRPAVAQSCPTLCDPMDYSPPSSSVHRILQAGPLEWVAISFSRGSSWPRDRTQVSCIDRKILYQLSYKGIPKNAQTTAQLHSFHMLVK